MIEISDYIKPHCPKCNNIDYNSEDSDITFDNNYKSIVETKYECAVCGYCFTLVETTTRIIKESDYQEYSLIKEE